MKLYPFPKLYAKINTKWTKHLSISAKTIKLLEKQRGEIFGSLDLAMISAKWKMFVHWKTLSEWKVEWEKIFTNYTPNKGLICRTYKRLLQLKHKSKNRTTWFKNGQRTWKDISPKKIFKCSIIHEKKLNIINKEMQIKITMTYTTHHTHQNGYCHRTKKKKPRKITGVSKDEGKLEH